MLKIKIFAIVAVLLSVGIVLNNSRRFSVSANDVADEIPNYKSWSHITKEPFIVRSYASTLIGV